MCACVCVESSGFLRIRSCLHTEATASSSPCGRTPVHPFGSQCRSAEPCWEVVEPGTPPRCCSWGEAPSFTPEGAVRCGSWWAACGVLKKWLSVRSLLRAFIVKRGGILSVPFLHHLNACVFPFVLLTDESHGWTVLRRAILAFQGQIPQGCGVQPEQAPGLARWRSVEDFHVSIDKGHCLQQ